jgi:hypothetical protein
VSAIIPLSDRRARLALILALLGIPSMGITLPAAAWLGWGAVRQQRLSSGAEPAMGFLALVVSGIDLLFVHQAAQRFADALGPAGSFVAITWAAGLAAGLLLLSVASLRIHPERRAVVLAVRAAMTASIAAGSALLVQLIAAVGA